MDRLSAVMLALALGACDDDAQGPAKSGGSARVDAVAAKTTKLDLDGFCDTRAAAGSARAMVLPEVAGTAPAAGGGWRWINVWATWCKPCVEELPMLAKLRGRFAGDHVPLELVFLSVDATLDEVASYRKAHPDTPESLQIKDAAKLGEWLASIGLAEDSALPIHLFVDDAQKIRCVRMGAVAEKDYETVRGLVGGG